MGQKINPTGFRVGIIRDWDAKWYANNQDFANYLHEDLRIRKFIEQKLADASVSRIEIERAAKRVNVSIHTAKPGMVIGKGGSEVETLRQSLNKLTGKRVHINIVEIKSLIWMPTLLVNKSQTTWNAVLPSVVQCVEQSNVQCAPVPRVSRRKSLVV